LNDIFLSEIVARHYKVLHVGKKLKRENNLILDETHERLRSQKRGETSREEAKKWVVTLKQGISNIFFVERNGGKICHE